MIEAAVALSFVISTRGQFTNGSVLMFGDDKQFGDYMNASREYRAAEELEDSFFNYILRRWRASIRDSVGEVQTTATKLVHVATLEKTYRLNSVSITSRLLGVFLQYFR